jgi:hypothetical protein
MNFIEQNIVGKMWLARLKCIYRQVENINMCSSCFVSAWYKVSGGKLISRIAPRGAIEMKVCMYFSQSGLGTLHFSSEKKDESHAL